MNTATNPTTKPGPQAKTTKQFIIEAKKIKPDHDYSKVVYINARIKVTIICPEGHEFRIIPYNFMSGHGCAKCAENYHYTTKEWIEKAKKIKPDHDYFKVDYVSNKIKVIITCPKGHEFSMSPNNFLYGQSCPECNSSKGEKAINEWLSERNISFGTEKEFEGLVGQRNGNLRFDFAVHKDNKLLFLLEYQGVQHFGPWGGDKATEGLIKISENTQAHDHLKIEYCNKHNIPLEFINYDEDIEECFESLIEKYKLTKI